MSQSLRNDTFGKPVQSVVSEASGNPWRKWPPHKDLAIAFEAFKLANQYTDQASRPAEGDAVREKKRNGRRKPVHFMAFLQGLSVSVSFSGGEQRML